MMVNRFFNKRVARLLRLRLLAMVFLALITTFTAFAAVSGSYGVEIYDNGELRVVYTTTKDPAEVLKQAGIKINEFDELDLSQFSDEHSSKIIIKRSMDVRIIDGEVVTIMRMIDGTVSDALNGAGITLNADDDVSPAPDTPLSDGTQIVINRSFGISITADGETAGHSVTHGTVRDALALFGVQLSEFDASEPDLDTELAPGMDIRVLRAFPITLNSDGQTYPLYMARGTVADALAYAEVLLGDSDAVTPSADTPLTPGLTISVKRAFPVNIKADGKMTSVAVSSGTVKDALERSGISYSKDDIVTPALSTKIYNGIIIAVDRVTYKTTSKTEAVPFKETTQKSGDLYVGVTKVKQEGRNGEKTIVYKEKYMNGKLVGSDKLSEKITKKPQNKIILVGTRLVKLQTNTVISPLKLPDSISIGKDGVPSSYKRVLTGSASAYTGGGRTATGKPAQVGYIAVDPDEIPYGSQLWIVSADGRYIYGYAIAADTGGFVNWTGSRATLADLYFNTQSECSQWGRRNIVMYVLS